MGKAARRKTRIVRVPGTTNNITKGVINFLRAEGHFAFRVNTMGIPLEDGSGWKKSGSEKGVADVLACMLPREGASGLFYAFEIKKGRDRASSKQIEFKENVERALGTVIEIKTYSDFLAWYRESKFSL